MLKLMKYEFRKMRTVLLILLASLVALELGFVLGYRLEKPDVWSVSLILITLLAFAVYAYILISGIVSYNRELTNRTGYLVFMTPTRPIGIVTSKLLFTFLAAVAAMALFALAAYLDYAFVFKRVTIDPRLLSEIQTQADLALKALFGDFGMSVNRLGLAIFYSVALVLIQVMYTMCTAYLAITLSATLLQNKKGFVRSLASFALFVALEWGAGRLVQVIIDLMPNPYSLAAVFNLLAASLGFYLVISALFAWASAALLKHKVSL